MIEINDKDVRLVETLEVISQHCIACDTCIFRSGVCGKSIPHDWDLDLLRERIKRGNSND